MQTILVSIISDQAMPNYLFIKEFNEQVDRYLFISTQKMENFGKTQLLCDAANIEKNRRIKTLIAEDMLYKNIEKLEKLNLHKDNTYLVNLTGGTKMMSIAVWRFFHRFEKTRFFYVPLGKNTYNELFDDKQAETHQFKATITCQEYLKIYGIRAEGNEKIFDEQQIFDLYNDVRSTNYDIDKFPKNKLKKLKKQHLNKQIHTKWFEEYVYYLIKNELNLDDTQIMTGIRLYEINQEIKNEYYQNDNEIDVFFIHKNIPYIIECKFGLGKEKINTETIQNALYKLAAINKRFGSSARATLFTLSDLSSLSENAALHLKRRCEITGIKYPLLDRNDLTQKKFSEKFNAFLNL